MRFIERIDKPEYLYRPQQALRRLTHMFWREPTIVDVKLPWGLSMRVRPYEDHGRAIWQLGIYDLVLSESIWRLLDNDEIGIDVGANIGYITGLMAARIGLGGGVIAFEPHPALYGELTANLARWTKQPIASIETFQIALSSKRGDAFLQEPKSFERNCGTARVVYDRASTLSIRMARLDDMASRPIGVLKLDVEGHEPEVIEGAHKLLETRSARDIIFEEHTRSFRSPVAEALRKFGYSIFALTRCLTAPLLVSESEPYPIVSYLPPNFLATCDPKRARTRFDSRGWQVLRG